MRNLVIPGFQLGQASNDLHVYRVLLLAQHFAYRRVREIHMESKPYQLTTGCLQAIQSGTDNVDLFGHLDAFVGRFQR
jgi:hypothetical protein